MLLCLVLLFAACHSPGEEALMPQGSVPMVSCVQASELVFPIHAENRPDTLPLLPEMILPVSAFKNEVGNNIVERAHILTFTTDDGLPMDDIMCGTLDRRGMLWFGTNGAGISRYDGHQFSNISTTEGLPDNVIISMMMDSKDILWIGTSTGGLCQYDGHRVKTIELNDATGLRKGIPCITEDVHGNVWVGTRGHGIYRLNDEGIKHYPLSDTSNYAFVRAITIAKDGTLWAGTRKGLYRFDGNDFIEYKESTERKLNFIKAMYSSDENTLWLGHEDGGITKCTTNGGDMQFEHFALYPGDEPLITCMTSFDQQHIWLGTKNHGAICFDASSQTITPVKTLNQKNGLAGNEVIGMVSDAHGDLWIGLRSAGLCHYRGDAFSNFTGMMPLSLAENALGELWIGTTQGLVKREDGVTTLWGSNVNWNSYVYSLCTDPNGYIGIASNLADIEKSGFSIIQDNQVKVLHTAADTKETFCSLFDRDHTLWIAGRSGVEKWTDQVCITYSEKQGLGNNNALCLLERRDGSIWAGTDGGGISRIGDREITTWTEAQGLPNDVIWCLTEDHVGALWAATLDGLCRYDGQTFLTYTKMHGLPDNNLQQVMTMHSGELMIGTLKGVATLTGWKNEQGIFTPFDQMKDIANTSLLRLSPVFEVYNSSTGFPVKDVQTAQHALFEDSDSTFWMSTGNAKTSLVHFNRVALKKDSTPVTLQLTHVQVNNEPVCWYHLADYVSDSITIAQQEVLAFGKTLTPAERKSKQNEFGGICFETITPHFPIPQGLVLNYRNNQIGFEFSGIETSRPEGIEYQYKLEGYDLHWSNPSKSNHVNYGNVSEGQYTFMVKAKNASGIWSEPLEYRFSVLPPWYRTWWAYCLYVIAAVLLVITYSRLRLQALRLQKVRLEKTVSERTEELQRKKEEADQQRERAEFSEKAKQQFLANMSHEIRTPMNAIMGMSDILRNRPHAPEQAKFLNAIAQSSENLMVIVNDILDLSKIEAGKISLESVKFSVHNVLENVVEVLQFKADEKKITLGLQISPEIPQAIMGDPTRINQILMNLVGNAIKFTETGKVDIHAYSERKDQSAMLYVKVTDTGIGIPEDRLNKIFEEFTQAYSDTTRKYGGTGLGLTISLRLAKMLGGDIKVESKKGSGSTFTFMLPLIEA